MVGGEGLPCGGGVFGGELAKESGEGFGLFEWVGGGEDLIDEIGHGRGVGWCGGAGG